MTIDDPFASAPDEAQTAPVAQPEPTPAPAAPVAQAPVQAPVTTAPAPAVANVGVPAGEGKVVLTFKGGSGYDAPWIVVHAEDLDDALGHVTTQAQTLLALMERVQKAGAHFSGLRPPVQGTGSVAAPAQASPSAPPAGAVSAPGGQSRQCAHGEMQFKSGVSAKTGKPWSAFFCPTPKDTPGQCAAEFLR